MTSLLEKCGAGAGAGRRKGTITNSQNGSTHRMIKIHTWHSQHLKLKSDVILKHTITSHGFIFFLSSPPTPPTKKRYEQNTYLT